MLAGSGMALVFPTAAASVLASVRPDEAGKASGANNAIREVGGVMGVAVLASVFSANGGYESPTAFNDGVVAALPVAVAVLAIGFVLAPARPRAQLEHRRSRRRARRRAGAAPATAGDAADLAARAASRKTTSIGKRIPNVWTLRQRGISRPAGARSAGRSASPSSRERNVSATGTLRPSTVSERSPAKRSRLNPGPRPVDPGARGSAP